MLNVLSYFSHVSINFVALSRHCNTCATSTFAIIVCVLDSSVWNYYSEGSCLWTSLLQVFILSVFATLKSAMMC